MLLGCSERTEMHGNDEDELFTDRPWQRRSSSCLLSIWGEGGGRGRRWRRCQGTLAHCPDAKELNRGEGGHLDVREHDVTLCLSLSVTKLTERWGEEEDVVNRKGLIARGVSWASHREEAQSDAPGKKRKTRWGFSI